LKSFRRHAGLIFYTIWFRPDRHGTVQRLRPSVAPLVWSLLRDPTGGL